MLYRLYTEDLNQDKIEALVNKYYPGFSIVKSTGFWRLQKENSLIIEIVTGPEDEKINTLARDIKTTNGQESVLVQKINNDNWLV